MFHGWSKNQQKKVKKLYGYQLKRLWLFGPGRKNPFNYFLIVIIRD